MSNIRKILSNDSGEVAGVPPTFGTIGDNHARVVQLRNELSQGDIEKRKARERREIQDAKKARSRSLTRIGWAFAFVTILTFVPLWILEAYVPSISHARLAYRPDQGAKEPPQNDAVLHSEPVLMTWNTNGSLPLSKEERDRAEHRSLVTNLRAQWADQNAPPSSTFSCNARGYTDVSCNLQPAADLVWKRLKRSQIPKVLRSIGESWIDSVTWAHAFAKDVNPRATASLAEESNRPQSISHAYWGAPTQSSFDATNPTPSAYPRIEEDIFDLEVKMTHRHGDNRVAWLRLIDSSGDTEIAVRAANNHIQLLPDSVRLKQRTFIAENEIGNAPSVHEGLLMMGLPQPIYRQALRWLFPRIGVGALPPDARIRLVYDVTHLGAHPP